MYKRFFKRIFDIIFGLIGVVVLIPTYIVVAPIIFFTDKGPVIYKSKRIGRNGKLYTMYKFRSMYVDAPDVRLDDGSTYNDENDPRVTPIGRFLRKTSIDEFPQFVNVLIGNMSLIGPRPDPPDWLDRYEEDEKSFLTAKPGITGYSQAYFRNGADSKEKIKNDVYYAEHITFWFDVKIFFKTIASVLKRENVYRDVSGNEDAERQIAELRKNGEAKTIMILGASILQLPAIKKALADGLNVVVADMNPDAIGFKEAGVIKEVVSTIDIKGVLEAAKRHKIDGIMTLASDMPMRTVAAVGKALGLPTIDEETALKATDKARMRDALRCGGVPVPCYYRVETESEFLAAAEKLRADGFKPIVKPADNSGSRGVDLIEENSDHISAYENAKKYSRSGAVLVEEYMEGDEVSVETMAVNGKVEVVRITDKITTGAPRFVETGHTQPSRLSPEIQSEIARVAIAANAAIGIKNGPSHTEIKITDGGAKVVEIGARLGGDCITTHLVPLSCGVDLVECCIRVALGETPDITRKFERGSAIRYFNQKAGVIEKIDGAEEAKGMAGVKEVSVVHGVGETITDVIDSASRVGYVVADGEDAAAAAANAENAAAKIKITVAESKDA